MNAPIAQCPHAKECPGCAFIGLHPDVAAERKHARVSSRMAHFSELSSVHVSALVRAKSSVSYRERAKLVADKEGRLGLYRLGTHEVEDLPGCLVLEPKVAATVSELRALIREKPVLEGVDVVRVDDGTLVTLIAREGTADADLHMLADALCARDPNVRGVGASERPQGAVQLLGKDLRLLRGVSRAARTLHEKGPTHFVSLGSFVQVHRDVAGAINERVRNALEKAEIRPGDPVLELYAGSGALSLWLAQAGLSVTAIESFPPACDQMRDAASAQRIALRVLTGDASLLAPAAAKEGAAFHAVIVNPPRRGLEVSVRQAIATLSPRVVAYVSCDPETLARDLSHLYLLGYRASSITPFDMMPLTDHVETLAILERAPIADVDVIYEDEALLAVNKKPHEPTTPQGEYAVSLLSRVRRRSGWEEAVPVHRLDLGTSGVCLFVRRAEFAEAAQKALSEGEKTYMALVRGVPRAKGRITRALVENGKKYDSATRYRRSEVVSGHSLVHAHPEQGRTHQIRRHFASIGHPILGDARYGDPKSNRHVGLKHGLDRTFLHNAAISLDWRNQALTLEAPLSPDLTLVLESLKRAGAGRR